MKIFFAIFLFFVSALARAEDYCQAPAKIDPDLLVGIVGTYELIGREPDSGVTYSGKLKIREDKDAYALARRVGGKEATGKAWLEYCSPDKFPVLKFRYEKTKKPLEGLCFFRMDGDNYYLISCRTGYAGSERGGLESMFQIEP